MRFGRTSKTPDDSRAIRHPPNCIGSTGKPVSFVREGTRHPELPSWPGSEGSEPARISNRPALDSSDPAAVRTYSTMIRPRKASTWSSWSWNPQVPGRCMELVSRLCPGRSKPTALIGGHCACTLMGSDTIV
jgi:hypothetical protein